VEVRFMDGAKLRGWIGEVSDTGFVLSHEVKRQLTKSQVAFNQVRACETKFTASNRATRSATS
jgi:hypothetical protein